MSIYVLPALLALVVKIYVLVLAHTTRTTRIFSGMVLVFALHNLTEVITYLQFARGEVSEALFRTYYSATLVMLFFMCVYCIEVTRISSLKKLYAPLTIWVVAGAVVVMASDWIIAGFTPISYAVTAIQGPYYWLFSATTLGALLFISGTLIYGYRRTQDHTIQIQCLYNLAALSPIVLMGFLVVPLIMMGKNVNAAGVLPICTTLFLLITLRSEARHRFTDIRRFLPFSAERKIADEVISLISQFSMDEISYKKMSKEIEKIAIQHKLEQADDSISEAARRLKMKRTTLYSMLDRHGIKRGEKTDS